MEINRLLTRARACDFHFTIWFVCGMLREQTEDLKSFIATYYYKHGMSSDVKHAECS